MKKKKRGKKQTTRLARVKPTPATSPAPATSAERDIEQSGADTDDQLIALWLAGRPPTTVRGYAIALGWWRARLPPVPLRQLRLTHIRQAMGEDDSGQAPATLAHRLAALRSLLAFGARVRYLPINVGALIKGPKRPNDLAERILEQDEIMRILAATRSARDHLLIRLLYVSGARVSEIERLDWEHVHPNENAAVLTLHGKGSVTRHVWITEATTRELFDFCPEAERRGLIFRARTGARLAIRDYERIVSRVAAAAGLPRAVSPHWLRHAHATHALERGAPVHVVAAALGHASVSTTTRYLHARPGSGSAQWLAL